MLVISANYSGAQELHCTDVFEGNGVQRKFSITGISLATDTVSEVHIDGVLVDADDYELLGDNSIQFDVAPSEGKVIEVFSGGVKVFEDVVFPINTVQEDRIQAQALYARATRNDYTNVKVEALDTDPGSGAAVDWVKLSVDNTNWFDFVELGTIKAGQYKRFYVKVEVPEEVPIGTYEDVRLEITGLEEITA